MVVFPNAKINLGLSIIEKRNDGYHNIETILYPVPLCDALEIIRSPNGSTGFTASGIEIPGNPDQNLCLKAWKMLQDKFDLPPIKLHLHKAIPMGAGLGGGSSDAAFFIKLINEEFELNLSIAEMQEFAGQLGTDCPFFIENKPVYAFQRGDHFAPVDINLAEKYLIVVKPDVHINTAAAYSIITPKKPAVRVNEFISTPIQNWKNLLLNDFEVNAIEKNPVIGTIKEMLYQQGALYASMTGSGSAVYGIFDHKTELKSLMDKHFYWAGWL